MNEHEELYKKYFTNFDGAFDGILARVVPVAANYTSEWAGSAARYDCRIKVKYQKELMAMLEEGMMVAVKNFRSLSQRSTDERIERFTVMVVSKIWPQHYGLGGVSDNHYYPFQREVIEQVRPDWETNDSETMMVQMSAIPINYDLIIDSNGEIEFRKGFSYPLIGDKVRVINMNTIDMIYNSNIKKGLGVTRKSTSPDPRKDPRVGTLRMFRESLKKIPIYVDLYKLVRYHFGVFSFTGGGKSNLLSNLFRRILYHTQDTKIVIFDISSEYPFLLSDVFIDPKIPSRIILEEEATSAKAFARSVVRPRDFEDDPTAASILERIYNEGKVTFYNEEITRVPTFGSVLQDIYDQIAGIEPKRPTYREAMEEILDFVINWMNEHDCKPEDRLTAEFIMALQGFAIQTMDEYSVYSKATIYGWASTRSKLVKALTRADTATTEGITVSGMLQMLRGPERLICISMSEPDTLRDLVIRLTNAALQYRKKHFETKPQILFVFDEAQEFIPSRARGNMERCSNAIERLLRQGRKYGLGGAIATQRIAYLNTNILQQLHTFFIGTLPRPYDRTVVSSSFQIDLSILDKTLEFPPGSWLLSSYIATGLDNVPIFIDADNSEEVIRHYINQQTKTT